MKKTVLNTLFCLLFITGTWSCKSKPEEKAVMAEKSKADSTTVVGSAERGYFEHESESTDKTLTLGTDELDALSKRAVQKLEDYYSYLGLMTNLHYDSTLRNHARTLARNLFTDASQIQTVLDSITLHPGDSLSYVIKHVSFEKQALSIGDTLYRGILSYELPFSGKVTRKEHCTYIIRRVIKRFGQEEKLVWEAFLEETRYSLGYKHV